MIEKLRKKFILISMLSIFLVLALIVASINISNYVGINKHSNEIVNFIIENNGTIPKYNKNAEFNYTLNIKPKNKGNKNDLPPNFSPEFEFSTRFFSVTLDNKNNIVTIDTGKVAALTTKEAGEYALNILNSGKTKGFYDIYKYSVVNKEDKKLVVFVDCNRELETFTSFLANSLLISALGMLCVFFLLIIFSKRIIKPVAESYEKQKRFITDAGHEIKTPLSIINANVEILEIENGENQWTGSIHHQISRLTELTNSLVSLAKLDESNTNIQRIDFSLSDAICEGVKPFLTIAASKNRKIVMNILKNISYHGNEQCIGQLVTILLDNAVKYSPENSQIEVTLKTQGKKNILVVKNSATNIKEEDLKNIFERFYRTDSSRSTETGGYGIGLSIAKAIVDLHNGKIQAKTTDGKFINIVVEL